MSCLWLSIVACDKGDASTAPDGAGTGDGSGDVEAPPPRESDGLAKLVGDMDPKADPCQDFYRYACGGWQDRTKLPGDKARYSRSFTGIQDANQEIIKRVLEAKAKTSGDMLGDFYSACMDTAQIEKAGRAPLDPILAEIDAIEDKKALMGQVGKLHATVFGRVGWLGGPPPPPFFNVYTEPDAKDAPDTEMAMFVQGGIGLPDRSMYLGKDARTKEVLAAYQAHVATMLELAGESEADATKHAAKIVKLETALAKASKERADTRDPEKNYNKIGFDGLAKRAKGVDWGAFFDGAGYPRTKTINVGQPKFFTALAKQIQKTDLDTLKAYLRWQTTQAMSPYLAAEFQSAGFELQKLTQGVSELPPRWKQCADEIMFAVPELIGPAFVAEAFGGESKPIALQMIDDIFAAMESTFPTLSWMDEVTGKRASEKIRALEAKIGYPDTWRDYSKLKVTRDSYFANALAERGFEHARMVAKIDAPRDMAEWLMPTPLVNAYAHQGEITFPAGIMQPPMFDAGQPAALNYGGIGAVIGHELTHHFDDQGRKYDKDGRLHEWWEPAVSKAFEERVACVVAQYDGYEVLPDLHVKGKLTAGENIADIGGVKQAHIAYQAWEKANGAQPVTEGLTNEQVFFVAWAQNWCAIETEESIRRRVDTDTHSPAKFRAEGPLADYPPFWAAFSCDEGTVMHPENACEVW